MRRVVVVLSVLGTLLAAGALSGCGEPAEDTTSGSLVLTVYTSGSLQGDAGPEAQDGADAVKLALEQADGMVGGFTVNVVSFDDTDTDTGHWGPDQVVGNARRAISDRNVIAYISDSDSGATALALPLLNEAGVLTVGPTTGYLGLTRRAGRGEPERFYPSGLRTFGRIAPADDVQARALLDTMRDEGVRRLAIVHDGELEALGLTSLLMRDAADAGIRVVTEKSVDPDDDDGSGPARDVVAAGADGAVYAGSSTRSARAVLDALHGADGDLRLFAPDMLADDSLASGLSADTARQLLITSPAMPFSELGSGAERFASAFRRAFGRDPRPVALFNYEAMRAVLAAVRGAGAKGNDRTAVIRAYFALRERTSALGPFAVTPGGDSTLRRYGVWKVRDGRLSFDRTIGTSG